MRHIKNVIVPADGSGIEYVLEDGSSIVKSFGSTTEPSDYPTTNVLMALASAVLQLSERVASLEVK